MALWKNDIHHPCPLVERIRQENRKSSHAIHRILSVKQPGTGMHKSQRCIHENVFGFFLKEQQYFFSKIMLNPLITQLVGSSTSNSYAFRSGHFPNVSARPILFSIIFVASPQVLRAVLGAVI